MMNNIITYAVIIIGIVSVIQSRIGFDRFKKYIHLYTFGASLFMLCIGIANYQGSQESSDYIPCPGYITDISSSEHYAAAAKQFRTEYSCTIHYTFTDGNDYIYEEDGLLEYPDENLSTVWVSPDNTSVHMSSSQSTWTLSIWNFLIAIVLFIVTVPLYISFKNKHPKPTMDELESAYIYGIIMAVCTFIFIPFMSYSLFEKLKYGETVDTPTLDIWVVLCIGFVWSVIVAAVSKKKMRSVRKRK